MLNFLGKYKERIKNSIDAIRGKYPPNSLACFYVGVAYGGMNVALNKDKEVREKLTKISYDFVNAIRESDNAK